MMLRNKSKIEIEAQEKKRMKNKGYGGMVWEGFPYLRKQKHTHPFHMKMLWTISKKNHNGIVKK